MRFCRCLPLVGVRDFACGALFPLRRSCPFVVDALGRTVALLAFECTRRREVAFCPTFVLFLNAPANATLDFTRELPPGAGATRRIDDTRDHASFRPDVVEPTVVLVLGSPLLDLDLEAMSVCRKYAAAYLQLLHTESPPTSSWVGHCMLGVLHSEEPCFLV